jgi:enoyl-CoA hydratase
MEYRTIRLQLDGPVARLSLARADDSNRLTPRLLRELEDACEVVTNRDEVRLALVEGEGPDFCAGWSSQVRAEGFELPFDPFRCLAELSKPVVCTLRGAVTGGGLELALAADVRICADATTFSLLDPELGGLPRAGGGQRLARLAGRGTALAMLLTGEALDAAGALRTGLVAKVVPVADLGAAAGEIARSIAEKGPIATRFAKEAIHRGLDMTLEQALRYETDLTIILQTTEDRAEGVRAFVEKREPEFKGK